MHLAYPFIQSNSALKAYILLVHPFPGNRIHELGDFSSLLYCLSYKNAVSEKTCAQCHNASHDAFVVAIVVLCSYKGVINGSAASEWDQPVLLSIREKYKICSFCKLIATLQVEIS